jgi:hypothetical protein
MTAKPLHATRRALLAALGCTTLAAAAANAARPEPGLFERVATFLVCENTSCTGTAGQTAAEIVTASADGRTLVYSDALAFSASGKGRIGFVDLDDPARPRALGAIEVPGEPTSVTVAGAYLLAAVNTSASYANPSGYLAVYDLAACRASLASCTPVRTLDVRGQPDSVAVSPDGRYAAVAVENERDENVTVNGVRGGLPQHPPGHLAVVDIVGAPASWGVRLVALAGLSAYAPADPEPEYVAINRANVAAVTLQENNHVVLVHLPTGGIVGGFDAGGVTLNEVDARRSSLIELDQTITRLREPDAIAWVDSGKLLTANEGDLFGGSRGFTMFDREGAVLYDSGSAFEHLAVVHGHFPERRAGNKGTEPEGLAVARYGHRDLAFVGSERGNFVAVYEVRGTNPVFRQLLPTGVGPEGLLPIPGRNLFVVATEVDSPVRSQINVFALRDEPASYPSMVSEARTRGAGAGRLPIAWGALSALAADRTDPDTLYTVHDSAFVQSRIFKVDVSHEPAAIVDEIVLRRSGATVNYDLEGLATREGGGFWAVSEGSGDYNASASPPVARANLLLEIAADGTVLREVALPDAVATQQRTSGFEGVAVTGSGAGERVWVAFQREWADDPAGFVRIGEFTPATNEWRFVRYPLDAQQLPVGGWIGLSEITALGGDRFAVIERDNQSGPAARLKRVYEFSLAGITPASAGSEIPVVPAAAKRLLVDLLPLLQGFNGWVLDKPEGFTVAADGETYAVTDNDGLNEATGETRFLRLGRIANPAAAN